MIVLDTNVVSEAVRPNCDALVEAWLVRQPVETLYLTTTSLAELLLGMELLPSGRRKEALRSDLQKVFEKYFENRILSYDEDAAIAYSNAIAKASAKGRAISVADGQIAAISKVHGFMVATRDTGPFEAAGVAVVNPWKL